VSEVRRLAPDDAEAFRALRLEMLRLHPTAYGSSHEEEADWPLARFEAWLEEQTVLGGYVDGELAGLVALRPYATRKFRHKAVLWCMYVREAARGRGLGADLVEAILKEAHRQGLEQVLLTVSEGNSAQRLYERAGFRIYGQEPRALRHDGQYVDELQMIRSLSRA
jgi:ribosomal protein S18 acetylase RimI-like enzyme